MSLAVAVRRIISPSVIFKSDKPTDVASVRKSLKRHLGKYVHVIAEYPGMTAITMGYLERFGDNIGLERHGGGRGAMPEKMDEQVAGMFSYTDRGAISKEAVPRYIVVHEPWMGKKAA